MQTSGNGPLINWQDIRRWQDMDSWEDEEEKHEKRAKRGKGKLYWRRRPYEEELHLKDDKIAG